MGIIIIIIFVTITLIILSIVSFVYFKHIRRYSPEDSVKSTIGVISIVASLATIIALFVAISTYIQSIKIQEENNEIILENLLTEIEGNIGTIEYFETNKEGYKEGTQIQSNNLKYYNMERALDFIKDKKLRRNMIIVIDSMQQSNIIFNFELNQPSIYDFNSIEGVARGNFRAILIDERSDINLIILLKLNSINKSLNEILE